MARILLIDDDEPFRSVLKVSLQQMGHDVIDARDGCEGVALYTGGGFDIVVTDLIMPDKEGIETIMDLRKLNPAVKIIAMSGGGRVTSVDYLQIARQVGAKRILAKPFLYEDIKVAIEQLMESPA
ncbi:MAG: response regulator [Rariglobus sp.]|nr:response regulator [Rariglobus sp.]